MNRDGSSNISWINPIGGLGDALMISGVLKLAYDRFPEKKYNLAVRTTYQSILKGHPAIASVGYPPVNADIIGTDYWAKEDIGPGMQRAFQILARIFGLQTPVEEILYYPGEIKLDPILEAAIPWGKKNIVISPSSNSPRKMMHTEIWDELVSNLTDEGNCVIQIGKMREVKIKKTYSLLGVTTPQDVISLVKKADLVITSDNFIMHAARLTGTPAIVLWGPTSPEIYGYDNHVHLHSDIICADYASNCLGKNNPLNYEISCPYPVKNRCMNQINFKKIMEEIKKELK